ncbi:hypothetical protein RJ640_019492 [Escallonia rubra]|uniref:Bidirectional sugar transporter SWEET n=1 Tax=Escallonia rubra TaxID=112253 RepID=A0AA88ULX1_9ASTE|nr:hypothetical protein RJ640_019492 [Escallonia rubra]
MLPLIVTSFGKTSSASHFFLHGFGLWFPEHNQQSTADSFFINGRLTFKRIVMNKSTEEFSGIPYVMTLLNCLLATWYGLPFVTLSNKNIPMSTINGTGAVVESIYVLIFLTFAPKKEKGKISGLLIFVLGMFSAIAFISIFALHGQKRKLLCGYAATVFSIIMYASPLSVMRTVIKTNSVEFMPFFLSLFVFLCGTSWFIFGLLEKDNFVAVSIFPESNLENFVPLSRSGLIDVETCPNSFRLIEFLKTVVQVPNGFGSGLGAIQLILYAIYCKSKGEKKKTTADGSLEKGLVSNGNPYQENISSKYPPQEGRVETRV